MVTGPIPASIVPNVPNSLQEPNSPPSGMSDSHPEPGEGDICGLEARWTREESHCSTIPTPCQGFPATTSENPAF